MRITRVAPHQLDDDNLASAPKHVRDALARALCPVVVKKGKRKGEVIGDDRDPRVTWHVTQRKGAPHERAVHVHIRHNDLARSWVTVTQGPERAEVILRMSEEGLASLMAGGPVYLGNALVRIVGTHDGDGEEP